MFWIALAAQISAAKPVHFIRWWSPDDMPRYIEEKGVTRIVEIRSVVRPDGAPQACATEESSGEPRLDVLTCAIVLKRGKFLPATWIDGTPVYGLFRSPVVWAIGDPSPSTVHTSGPDMDLQVDHLPKGVRSPTSVRLAVAVEANGQVVSCAEAPWPSDYPRGEKVSPELVPLACQQVTKTMKLPPAEDSAGKAVRSVQTLSVLFRTPK